MVDSLRNLKVNHWLPFVAPTIDLGGHNWEFEV